MRLIGVGVSGLSSVQQLSLWDEIAPAPSGDMATSQPAPPTPEPAPASPTPLLQSTEIEASSLSQEEKRQRLEQTLSMLKEQFGPSVIQVAGHLDSGSNPPN